MLFILIVSLLYLYKYSQQCISFPSMVQHSGHFPVLLTLKLFSTRFLEGFSTYSVKVIPACIVHCMHGKSGQSIYNLVYHCSTSLFSSAPNLRNLSLFLLHLLFILQLNSLFGLCHQNCYDDQYCVCVCVLHLSAHSTPVIILKKRWLRLSKF